MQIKNLNVKHDIKFSNYHFKELSIRISNKQFCLDTFTNFVSRRNNFHEVINCAIFLTSLDYMLIFFNYNSQSTKKRKTEGHKVVGA